MVDPILESFLRTQRERGMALAASSDILDLCPEEGDAPRRYLARFRCRTVLRAAGGAAAPAMVTADVGIWFPAGYLRAADAFHVLSVMGPRGLWHPNISAPFLCIGALAPGTSLPDILYRVYEVLAFNRVTPREDDCLNPAACRWAREQRSLFPVDRRPLKRAGSAAAGAADPEGKGARP